MSASLSLLCVTYTVTSVISGVFQTLCRSSYVHRCVHMDYVHLLVCVFIFCYSFSFFFVLAVIGIVQECVALIFKHGGKFEGCYF
jgi:hypothetical protein